MRGRRRQFLKGRCAARPRCGRGSGRGKGVGRRLQEKISDFWNVSDIFGRFGVFSGIFERFRTFLNFLGRFRAFSIKYLVGNVPGTAVTSLGMLFAMDDLIAVGFCVLAGTNDRDLRSPSSCPYSSSGCRNRKKLLPFLNRILKTRG